MLHPDHVLHDHCVRSSELAKCLEGSRLFEYSSLDRSRAQSLGEAERIALVALRTSALRDARHHDLRRIRGKDLVEPRALRALLETHAPFPGDRLELFDQRVAIRLHHVRLEPLAARAHHRERRACRMNIQPDISLHRRPPSKVLLLANKASPSSSEDASFRRTREAPPRRATWRRASLGPRPRKARGARA